MELSVQERQLLRQLQAEPLPSTSIPGFATEGEALSAAAHPQRLGLVSLVESTTTTYQLTEEGKEVLSSGSPERQAVNWLNEQGGKATMGEFMQGLGKHGRVAIGWLRKNGWANMEKGEETVLVATASNPDLTPLELALQAIHDGKAADGAPLVERQWATRHDQTTRTLALTREGEKVRQSLPEGDEVEVNQVTPELLARWGDMSDQQKATTHIRPFHFDTDVAPAYPGKPHPLNQMMAEIRDIFFAMGFTEIRGDYVESAYWNMDALFIPQDHPARDMQDTFYLEDPKQLPVDKTLLARAKAVHQDGGETGSAGWGGTFDEEVSQQALLRTHTTNTTVRYLAECDKTDSHKVFGLGRVFRKETMDATHLPEFTQIEGIVTEPNANFNMLIGLAKAFFTRMGFPDVRFRPAYFPYTEPSMEIDVMYKGKWMELGGCGMFRPEVTEPLGVKHPVLAWGFGLERLAMMRLGLKDIRDLYVSDIKWLRESPLQR